jgi:hypothetical protein
LAQAARRLAQFFRANGNESGDTAKFVLGIDLDIPGRAQPIALQRSVVATLQSHHQAGDMEPRYRLQWAPEVAGPFPLFSGELTVGGTEDYDSFVLHLKGDYAPPLGLLGQGFDAVLGKHIAAATADNFLHVIRNAIERDYREDEAGKHLAGHDD